MPLKDKLAITEIEEIDIKMIFLKRGSSGRFGGGEKFLIIK